jgi:hypothetical protein
MYTLFAYMTLPRDWHKRSKDYLLYRHPDNQNEEAERKKAGAIAPLNSEEVQALRTLGERSARAYERAVSLGRRRGEPPILEVHFDEATGKIVPYWLLFRVPYQLFHIPSKKAVHIPDDNRYSNYLAVIFRMLDCGVQVTNRLPERFIPPMYDEDQSASA